MTPIKRIISMVVNLPLLLAACDDGPAPAPSKPLEGVKGKEAALKVLLDQRIFFGHQSVGVNIMDGIKDVIKELPELKLNLKELKAPAALEGPSFAHAAVGKNQDPASKDRSFAEYMRQGIGKSTDIAFYKYCYIDLQEDSDYKAIFAAYKKSMDTLIAEFPETKIVQVTVPVRMVQTGMKTKLKKLMGKLPGGAGNNKVRNQFNELLRRAYEGKQPIFDLARFESTRVDGSRSYFNVDGKTYFSMVPEYTYDSGHLNEKGRKVIAEQLLLFLADLVQVH